MKPARDDLRVVIDTDIAGYPVHKEITDADLAAMGLVQAPECEDCEDGIATTASGGRYLCHTCGGSGYGRLVALDEMRPIKMCEASGERMWGDKCESDKEGPCPLMYVWLIPELADRRQVLAALDEEET